MATTHPFDRNSAKDPYRKGIVMPENAWLEHVAEHEYNAPRVSTRS
jgi:hypothetical protein